MASTGCLLALAWVALVYGEGRIQFNDERPIMTCLYQNKTYNAGTKFRPDPCTYCHCPHHGGRARCAIQDCQFLANCVRYDKEEDECCGRCMEYGCLHTDDQVYPARSVVVSTKCERCICPPGGGKVVCARVRCPPVMCVDPVKLPEHCCYSCPNGPNCYLSDRVIPAGREVQVDKCTICRCPEVRTWSQEQHSTPQAQCAIIDDKSCK